MKPTQFFDRYKPSALWHSDHIYSCVPIGYLEEFRAAMRREGRKAYKIYFRGPRNTVHDRNRGRNARSMRCIKAAAVAFSAYSD